VRTQKKTQGNAAAGEKEKNGETGGCLGKGGGDNTEKKTRRHFGKQIIAN